MLFRKPPDYSYLHVFRLACWLFYIFITNTSWILDPLILPPNPSHLLILPLAISQRQPWIPFLVVLIRCVLALKPTFLPPKHFSDGTIQYPMPRALIAVISYVAIEPHNFTEAMKFPEWCSCLDQRVQCSIKK